MQIIAGRARGINLQTPPSMAVRPTTGRSRKALFDSLGSFESLTVVDLCAGSGALGLESASRGAAEVILVEQDRRHCRYIEQNISAVKKSGVDSVLRLIDGSILDVHKYQVCKPDLIFADPPYADSLKLWRELQVNTQFLRFSAGAFLVWELPDIQGVLGEFMLNAPLIDMRVRKFGPTDFLIGRFKELE